ncbi:hypothetical protein ILYODFUR_022831 [Ilyodon furcidens]|uniref:Uncharacterized protein n=1 Tax=Ilyodon furcidens TaxID=33524 RepID=A0ABV0UID9_9TELE
MTDQKVDLKEKKRNTSTPSLPRGPISPPAVHSSSLKLTYSLSPTACEVRHFVRMYSVGINKRNMQDMFRGIAFMFALILLVKIVFVLPFLVCFYYQGNHDFGMSIFSR